MNQLAKVIFDNAKAKGFHEYTPHFGVKGRDARHILSWLMLIATEVAEAAEEVRVGNREKFAEEMADVIIRCLDTCYALGIDIDAAVAAKLVKNAARPVMHGGKLA